MPSGHFGDILSWVQVIAVYEGTAERLSYCEADGRFPADMRMFGETRFPLEWGSREGIEETHPQPDVPMTMINAGGAMFVHLWCLPNGQSQPCWRPPPRAGAAFELRRDGIDSTSTQVSLLRLTGLQVTLRAKHTIKLIALHLTTFCT